TQQKLICRNVSPECGLACLAGRHTCRDNVATILATGQLPSGGTLDNCSTGTDACDAALQQGRQGCRAQYCAQNQTCTSCGDPNITDHNACYECVDPFQLTAFSCRDACRDSFRQNAEVKAAKQNCHAVFQSCISTCPPAMP